MINFMIRLYFLKILEFNYICDKFKVFNFCKRLFLKTCWCAHSMDQVSGGHGSLIGEPINGQLPALTVTAASSSPSSSCSGTFCCCCCRTQVRSGFEVSLHRPSLANLLPFFRTPLRSRTVHSSTLAAPTYPDAIQSGRDSRVTSFHDIGFRRTLGFESSPFRASSEEEG